MKLFKVGVLLAICITIAFNGSHAFGGMQTDYRRGCDLAASDNGLIFVACGRTVTAYDVQNGEVRGHVNTGYDGGDSIAADGEVLFSAEDDGGWVDGYNIYDNRKVVNIRTSYDGGDRLAASYGQIYVAEDDGGRVEIYEIATQANKGGFNTGYDGGDDIAATRWFFLVAEDDGGWVDIHYLGDGYNGRKLTRIRTGYDRGDRLAAYMTTKRVGTHNTEYLMICVAEDDGGWVEIHEIEAMKLFE